MALQSLQAAAAVWHPLLHLLRPALTLVAAAVEALQLQVQLGGAAAVEALLLEAA